MKQRISKTLTLAIPTLALVLASCIADVRNTVIFGDGEGEPVTISFNPLAAPDHATRATRGYHDGGELEPGDGVQGSDAIGREPEDVEIVDIRVLLYKASTGQFVAEDDAQGFDNSQPVELELVTGTYDVVLIANSSSDTGLTGPGGKFDDVFGDPDDYNNLNKVKNALLDSRAFNEDDTPIPMFALVRDVHISLDGSVQVADGTPQNTYVTPWAPVLERVGVRLSMEITLNPYQYADWVAATNRKIEISALPEQAWLWGSGKFNGGLSDREATARVYTATSADVPTDGYDGYTIHVEADPDAEPEAIEEHYVIRYDRIIGSATTAS